MDPVRCSVAGGVIATAVLSVYLFLADFVLAGTDLFVYATFTSLCFVGGPPYCAVDSVTAAVLTFVWFVLLFVVAWPLLFGGFTWGLPGESGTTHGVVFSLILWAGYVVGVLYGIGLGGETLSENLGLLVITLVGYLLYGAVLGGGYDHFAHHRTVLILSDESP